MKDDPLKKDPNFEVENEQMEAALKDLGAFIGQGLPKGVGFSLLLFNFGEGGSTFYTSNANRQDVIKAMEEFIAKHKKKPRSIIARLDD